MRLNPRRRAREAVIDALPELAASRGCEAQWSLRVIVEDPEHATQIGSRRRQIAAYSIQDQQRVVAVSARLDVVRGHHTRRAIIAAGENEAVEEDGGQRAVSGEDVGGSELREGDGAEVGRVATRKLDVLVSNQGVELSRDAVRKRRQRHNVPSGSRIQIRGLEGGRLVLSQTDEGISNLAIRSVHKKQVYGDAQLRIGVGDVDARV